MIRPVNNYLLIEPLKHESFVASEKGTFEEVGKVLAVASDISGVEIGQSVLFDSWLVGKYELPNKVVWLVSWGDVKAIDDEVSE